VITVRDVLQILEEDSRTTPEEIAIRLNRDVNEVRRIIADALKNRVLLRYSALVNWEAIGGNTVFAFIDVSATPQHGEGFDAIAEYISKFDEVHSVYLMSGASDLTVVVEGEDFREVARFVAEKLAPIPGVRSTATSFVLKTYKMENTIISEEPTNGRLAVAP
jgi:DNA-binding Lrp family transcriptional regulator